MLAPRFTSVLYVPLLLIALAATGCSSDKSTDPGNGGGGGGNTSAPVAAYAADVDAVAATYFDANAAAYQSLGVLGPAIGQALSASSGPMPTSGAAQASCLAPEIVGTTFEWDGVMYVAGPDAGAPANGARFVIYAINPTTSEPDTNNVIGHLDASCTVVDPSTYNISITAVMNGVTILQQSGSVTSVPPTAYLLLQGYLGAAGVGSLDTIIQASTDGLNQTAVVSTGFEMPTRDISLGVTVRDSLASNRRDMVAGAAKGYLSTLQWVINVHAVADFAENIQNGGAYLDLYGTSQTGYRLVACVTGGTLSAPTLAAPDLACDTWLGGAMLGSSSEADRAAATVAYARLYAMHVAVRGLIGDLFGVEIGGGV